MRVRLFLFGVALTAASPVLAYKLVPANAPIAVAKSGLTVAPNRPWNRLGARPGRFAETWTLDGIALNDMTFYGGIADDTTLFREVDKTDRPLPRFSKTMLAPDIAQLFEASYRVALSTSLMSIDSIEPASFAGHEGFRFTYTYTVQNDEIRRKGEARGAIVGDKLWMATFEAPAIHYFERDLPAFRQVADSARIGAAGPRKR